MPIYMNCHCSCASGFGYECQISKQVVIQINFSNKKKKITMIKYCVIIIYNDWNEMNESLTKLVNRVVTKLVSYRHRHNLKK